MSEMESIAVEIVAAMLNDRFGKWGPWARLSDARKDELRHDARCIIEALLGDPHRAADLDPACVDFIPALFGMEQGAPSMPLSIIPSTFAENTVIS